MEIGLIVANKIRRTPLQYIPEHKARKNYRFMLWASLILRKRNLKVNLNSCVLDRLIKVEKVIKIGHGYAFMPKKCFGCSLSFSTDSKVCWLEETWIPCPVKIKVDEVIYMPSLEQMLSGRPVLRCTNPDGFLGSHDTYTKAKVRS